MRVNLFRIRSHCDSDDRGAARLNAAAPTAPCRCAACSSSCSPRAFVEHGALRSCLRPRRSCRITPNWRPRARLRDKTFRMCMRYDRALTSHTTPGSGTTKPRHHRFFLAASPEPQLELNDEPARGRGTYSLPSTCARAARGPPRSSRGCRHIARRAPPHASTALAPDAYQPPRPPPRASAPNPISPSLSPPPSWPRARRASTPQPLFFTRTSGCGTWSTRTRRAPSARRPRPRRPFRPARPAAAAARAGLLGARDEPAGRA